MADKTMEALIDKFSKEPMDQKWVSEVPGVQRRLKTGIFVGAGIVKAAQLYDQLRELDFDEEKLRAWMKLMFNIGKPSLIRPIYEALMAWRANFGDDPLQGKEAEEERTESPAQEARDSSPTSAAKKRINSSHLSTPDREPRPRVSFQIDVANRSLHDDRSLYYARTNSNELMQYLASFSTVFKSIPEEHRIEFRRDILNIVEKYENKIQLKIYPNESQPSTSR